MKLKPCPFCGGPAEIYNNGGGEWDIRCSRDVECPIEPSATFEGCSKKTVIKAWNTRKGEE